MLWSIIIAVSLTTLLSARSVSDDDLPSREHKEVHEPCEDR